MCMAPVLHKFASEPGHEFNVSGGMLVVASAERGIGIPICLLMAGLKEVAPTEVITYPPRRT